MCRFYSFLLVSILISNFSDAYTVVLLGGKRLDGKLIGEDSITIQLRDPSSGVVLSIKKSGVDLDATLQANVVTEPPAKADIVSTAPPPKIPEKSVVEVAREVRASRTGYSRVYTRDDLNKVPEISFGNDVEIESDQNSGAGKMSAEQNLDESYWRKTAATFRKELATLRDRKISAEFSCEKAREKRSSQIYGGNRRPSDLNQAFDQPPECKRFEEIQTQLSDAQWRWDEFTERARRAAVPWAWIE